MNAKLLSAAALVVIACGPNFPIEPAPRCGASHVTASLSSVTLAQDCGGSVGEAKASADFAAGVCAEGYPCPSLCRQSSMQLAFGSMSALPVGIEIRAVRLMDPTTNKLLQTLTSREPQHWVVDRYLPWNQLLAPGAELKATYKLSAPSYDYTSFTGRSAYQPYRVEVDVAIDGEVRTLQAQATREPEVAT